MSKDPRFVIKKSKTGLGLFARTAIAKNDFIMEYIGKKITTEVADTLSTKYLFDLENGFTIDGASRSNTARYINHSCDENTEAEISEDFRILIHAVKNIKAGEELTIDYGEEYFDEFIRPYGCLCGGEHCRSAFPKKV